MTERGYVHGFTTEEQDRLYRQARLLEPEVFRLVDFSKSRRLLEVGCGVGAQTEILLKRFPQLHIDGVDASETQIARAKEHLSGPIARGQVSVQVADAGRLPFPTGTHDAAFICWFLEHVSEPLEILREVKRSLKAGGRLFCNEVHNATFFVHPYSPKTLQYWFQFNDHQWELGGDPFVGAKLGNLLTQAGFRDVETHVRTYHFDNRTPKERAGMIEEWTELLLSGAPGLIESGRVKPEDAEELKRELDVLKDAEDSVFFYSWLQAHGTA